MKSQNTRSIGLFVSCLTLAACNGGEAQYGPVTSPLLTAAQLAETARVMHRPAHSGGVQYAYVSNWEYDKVDLYSVDATSGALGWLGSVGESGGGPQNVVFNPAGTFAYLATYYSDDIDVYAIKARSGALTPIAGSPFGAGTNPIGMAITPAGTFAYLADSGSANVSAYAINATSGTLTQVAGSPFAAGKDAVTVAIDPTGKFAYVPNESYPSGPGSVSAYTISPSNGALTPVNGSPFTAGTEPSWAAADPKGKFLYVVNYGSNNVSAFRINAASGALTQVAGSPFAGGTAPVAMIVDPKGKFVYTANYGTSSGPGSVSAYRIESNGALAQVTGSPFAAGTEPEDVATDVTDSFLYASNYGSANISAYTIDATTGALTPIAGSPFFDRGAPDGITICRRVGRACVPPPV